MVERLARLLEGMLKNKESFRISVLEDTGYKTAYLLEDIQIKAKDDKVILEGVSGTIDKKIELFVNDYSHIDILDVDKNKKSLAWVNPDTDDSVYEIKFLLTGEDWDLEIRQGHI